MKTIQIYGREYTLLLVLAIIGLVVYTFSQFLYSIIGVEGMAILASVVVLSSYPIYTIRVYRRQITTNIVTWTIFTLISLSLLLTYNSSGAKENGWVIYGQLIGTVAVLLISFFRNEKNKLKFLDWFCLIAGTLSIVLWYFTKEIGGFAQYVLCLVLFIDLMGLIPTVVFVKKNPDKDRPGTWIIFSFGYFLSMFTITEHTFSNWILPTFMVIIPALVWWPLVKFRIKISIPLKEWI